MPKELQALGVVTDAPQPQSRFEAYCEHVSALPAEAQARLYNARVLVMGLGGLGSILIQHLVAVGVRRYVLVDHDTVDPLNLERQFIHHPQKCGQSKVASAADYLQQRVTGAEVEEYRSLVSNSNEMAEILARSGPIDAAAACIDHPPTTAFRFVGQALWQARIPFIHGGVMIRSGFFGPFFAPTADSPTPDEFAIWHQATPTGPAPQPVPVCFPPYNTIIGAHMAADLLHWLIGNYAAIDFKKRTFVNFDRMRFIKLHSQPASPREDAAQ